MWSHLRVSPLFLSTTPTAWRRKLGLWEGRWFTQGRAQNQELTQVSLISHASKISWAGSFPLKRDFSKLFSLLKGRKKKHWTLSYVGVDHPLWRLIWGVASWPNSHPIQATPGLSLPLSSQLPPKFLLTSDWYFYYLFSFCPQSDMGNWRWLYSTHVII